MPQRRGLYGQPSRARRAAAATRAPTDGSLPALRPRHVPLLTVGWERGGRKQRPRRLRRPQLSHRLTNSSNGSAPRKGGQQVQCQVGPVPLPPERVSSRAAGRSGGAAGARARRRYLAECLERRDAPDVWFLADPAAAAADLRGCLSPRAPSVGSVCQVCPPGHGPPRPVAGPVAGRWRRSRERREWPTEGRQLQLLRTY